MVWDSPEQLCHEGGSETLLKAMRTAHAEGTHTAQPVCPPMIQSFPDGTPAGGGLATVGAPGRLHGPAGRTAPEGSGCRRQQKDVRGRSRASPG